MRRLRGRNGPVKRRVLRQAPSRQREPTEIRHGAGAPRGTGSIDILPSDSRRQIIKDFYANWIAQHPDKKVWNKSLNAFIHVKYQSINETAGHAALSSDSTMGMMHLTDILEKATVTEEWPVKHNDKNQKPYAKMYLLRWKTFRLIVGLQKTTGEYVQYYVGSQ